MHRVIDDQAVRGQRLGPTAGLPRPGCQYGAASASGPDNPASYHVDHQVS